MSARVTLAARAQALVCTPVGDTTNRVAWRLLKIVARVLPNYEEVVEAVLADLGQSVTVSQLIALVALRRGVPCGTDPCFAPLKKMVNPFAMLGGRGLTMEAAVENSHVHVLAPKDDRLRGTCESLRAIIGDARLLRALIFVLLALRTAGLAGFVKDHISRVAELCCRPVGLGDVLQSFNAYYSAHAHQRFVLPSIMRNRRLQARKHKFTSRQTYD